MVRAAYFLSKTREDTKPLHWSDWFSYAYLIIGALIVLIPMLWLGISSIKSDQELNAPTPRFFERVHGSVQLEGYENRLLLYEVTSGGLKGETVAEVARNGTISTVIRPEMPDQKFQLDSRLREPAMRFSFATENYTELFSKFDIATQLANSVIVLMAATMIMLIVNAMAAFALSRYEFKGRDTIIVAMLFILLVPQTVTLVPLFYLSGKLGLTDNLWGIILPSAATPAGIFLLRQYMLTIPEHILQAARMDRASEWKIFWRIMLPMSKPALVVLAILSIMWNWNDFLWPLIVTTNSENSTLQLALYNLHTQTEPNWGNVLAMTTLLILPVALAFSFLQKHITAEMTVVGGK